MKSLERSETEFTVGVSVITGKGVPEIGRSKPFFYFNHVRYALSKNNQLKTR